MQLYPSIKDSLSKCRTGVLSDVKTPNLTNLTNLSTCHRFIDLYQTLRKKSTPKPFLHPKPHTQKAASFFNATWPSTFSPSDFPSSSTEPPMGSWHRQMPLAIQPKRSWGGLGCLFCLELGSSKMPKFIFLETRPLFVANIYGHSENNPKTYFWPAPQDASHHQDDCNFSREFL